MNERLSDRVMDIVTDCAAGLFPKPGEIELACNCPDSATATMCNHAAAVLYGVGSRLDDNPELLFRLRGVDEVELIATDAAPHCVDAWLDGGGGRGVLA